MNTDHLVATLILLARASGERRSERSAEPLRLSSVANEINDKRRRVLPLLSATELRHAAWREKSAFSGKTCVVGYALDEKKLSYLGRGDAVGLFEQRRVYRFAIDRGQREQRRQQRHGRHIVGSERR